MSLPDSPSQAQDLDHCDYMHVHEDIVAQVNETMPDEEILYDLAELFIFPIMEVFGVCNI